MPDLAELFTCYDKSQQLGNLPFFTRYGFEWNKEDGIILYPHENNAGFLVVLLRQILPDIPVVVCDDDQDQIGKIINGVTVTSLQEAVQACPRALFVLCHLFDSAEAFVAKVVEALPVASASRVITYRQLGDFLPVGGRQTRPFDVFRKTDVFATPKNRLKVRAAYDLFKDSMSKSVFLSVLRRYLFAPDSMIPAQPDKHPYFAGFHTWLEDEVFIDCGGFTGDTFLEYLDEVGESGFKEYILFEPDPANFTVLMETVSSCSSVVRNKVTALPYALGHERESTQFDALGNAGSFVNPEGSTTIQTVALDDEVFSKKPTFMKFDIEGYEAFALQGAKNTIITHRPVLAICVYHHPFDLFTLPLMVHQMVPYYTFILRANLAQYDYICFAIPPERINAL